MSSPVFERKARSTRRKALWFAIILHIAALAGFAYGDQITDIFQDLITLTIDADAEDDFEKQFPDRPRP